MIVTIAGKVKCYYRGEWYRPGDTLEVAPLEYEELLAKGFIKDEQPKEVKKEKEKK